MLSFVSPISCFKFSLRSFSRNPEINSISYHSPAKSFSNIFFIEYRRKKSPHFLILSVSSNNPNSENASVSSPKLPAHDTSANALDLKAKESNIFLNRVSKYNWVEYDRALEKLDIDKAVSILESFESSTPASFQPSKSFPNPSVSNENMIGIDFAEPEKDFDFDFDLQSNSSVGNELAIPSSTQTKLFQILDIGLAAENIADVSRAYAFLQLQRLLPNFGIFNPITSTLPRKVTPQVLKEYCGIDVTKLSPQKWGMANSVGPLLVFGMFCTLMNNDVLVRPIVASILSFFLFDSVVLGSTSFGQIRSLIPSYRKRILVHEAGHILSAYLLGCPIRGVILNSWEAIKMGIKGQAGTQFWDETLEAELYAGRLTMASIDRYCIVLFSGIAAEAMEYGQAEGGEGDENLFKSVLGSLQPAWSTAKMANQARWSVVQAYLLLTKYRDAHAAVVDELGRGSSLGVIIQAIESRIPKQ